MQTKGCLYLIPVTLADVPLDNSLPRGNADIIKSIRYFVVEQVRTARRFLKKVDTGINIDELHFNELNKRTDPQNIASFLLPIERGESVGVISEAGCPAIADPGADVVAIAQRKGYKVVPLVGPSSILLSLMASGFNGQTFTFNGYIPIEERDRASAIKNMESLAAKGITQIFIETPYRNNRILSEIIKNCKPSTMLCVASNITSPDEWIQTKAVSWWRGFKEELPKTPTIFLIGI